MMTKNKTLQQSACNIIETATFPIFSIDRTGEYQYLNSAAAGTFNRKPEEVVGKTMWDLFPKPIADKQMEAINKAIDSKRASVSVSESEVNGKKQWFEAHINPIVNEKGKYDSAILMVFDITDQKRSDEHNKVFKEFAQSAKLGFGMATPDGIIEYVNPALCEMLEITVDEILGNKFVSYYPPDMQKKLKEEVIPAIMKKGAWHGELYFETKSGKIVNTAEHYSIIKDEQGRPKYINAVIKDITEEKKLEQERREQQQFLQSIYEGTDSSIFVIDVEEDGTFRFVSLNPAHEKISGMKSEWVKGRTLDDLVPKVPKEAIPEIKANYQRCVDAGETIEYEEMIPMSGKNIWWLTKLTPAKNEDGRIYRIIGSAIDITELKELQQSKIESAALKEQAAFVEAMDDAVLVLDMDGVHQFTNPAFLKLIQYDKDDLLGTHASEIIPKVVAKEDLEIILPNLKKLVKGQKVPTMNIHLQRKDGNKIPVSLSVSFRLGEDGQPKNIIGSFRDMSELVKAQEEQRKSEEKFSHFVKYLPMPLCNVDNATGKILYFNETFHNTFGYTLDDIPTLDDWWVKAYPDKKYRKWVINNWNQAVDKAAKTDSEIKSDVYNVTCKDGSQKKIIIGGVALRNEFLATFLDVTDQKKAEEQRQRMVESLKQSEAKFRRLTENAQDMIYRMSLPDGHYEYVSPASKEIWGYTPEEVYETPKLIAQCLHPDYEDYFKKEWQKLLDGNMPPTYEYKIIDKTGKEKWLYQRNVLIKDEQGKPISIEGIVTDVTERIKAEEQFEKIFNLSSDLICVADINGYFRQLNPAWERILGYSRKELMGKPFLDFIHPDDKDRTLKVIEEKLEKGEAVLRFENRYIRKDGNVVWLEWASQPNIIEGITFAMARDVTDRKEAEQQLYEQQEKFRILFEAEPDAILTADPQTGILLDVNRAATKLFKRSKEELIGMHQTLLHPPEIRDKIADKFREIAVDESNEPQQIPILDGNDNTIQVEVVGTVVELSGKPVAIGIFRDVTSRIEAQQAIMAEKAVTESTIDSLPGIFYQINKSGHYTRWNKKFLEVTDMSNEKMKSVNALDFFKGDDVEKVSDTMEAVFTKGEAEVEANLITASGKSLPYLFTGRLFTIDNEPYIIGMGLDVSHLKKIENSLRKSNTALQSFNKMAVGREKRMIALKKMINALNKELGRDEPFDLPFAKDISIEDAFEKEDEN